MESARIKGATTEVVRNWWPLLKIPAILAIKPENRYNMDEGGLMEGKTSNGLVLGLRGTRPLQRKELGSRAWTSFIECISATGKRTPLLVIFKGKSVQEQWFPDDITPYSSWHFTATENGWTDDATAREWLEKVFLPATKPPTFELRLLILDGHGFHATTCFPISLPAK